MKTFSMESLKSALLKIREIDFSILFGSSRDGTLINDTSDIDIAVYLSVEPGIELITEIIGICQDILDYENIDLVVLNKANPLLSFHALSGEILTCKDIEQYASFFSLTCRLYEDEMMRINRSLLLR